MRFKKNPPPKRWTWPFLFWNHNKIGQQLLPLKVPSHRKIEFGIVFMFLYYFIHSLIPNFLKKIGPALLPLKVRHTQHWTFELIYLNVYFDCISFFQLIWFILNTGMTFSVLKSFNNSPACIYFHSKCSHARLSLNCIYVSLFIHSFIHLFIFFLLLFICFTLFNLH